MSESIASAVRYWESKASNAVTLAAKATRWRHQGERAHEEHEEPHAPKRKRRKPGPKPAISERLAEKVRADRAAGASLPTLAIRYRTSYRTLYRILKER